MHRESYTPRLVLVALSLVGGFAVLGYRLYGIQVLRHEELYEKAKAKYTASSTQSGQRGLILDVHGRLLAGNMACRDVLAEPRLFRKEAPVLVQFLSRRLGVPRDALAEKFALAYREDKPLVEVVLCRGLDMKKAQDLEADLQKMKVKGIRFVDSYRRYYPKQALLANLIGFVDSSGVGVAGVEKMQDARLQPGTARSTFERDRKGTPIPNTLATDGQPHDGASVYLTIDESIQQIVETELRAMVETFQPRAAYGLMANPRTGAILAMAQYPTFNPNDRREMDPEAWQNRMLVEGFEPGSIMKAVPICGAFDYGVVSPGDRFFCENGMWWFHGRSLRDSGHRYQWLNVREIVQKSSNIGTAKIAVERLGEKRLFQIFTRFGFGKPTGIGLENEATGIFRPLARWDGLSISRFPIGQGILVTPLQMVQAYCALANHGDMYQLHFIDRTGDRGVNVWEFTQPRLKAHVARPEAVAHIVSALTLVCQEGGTAPKAAVEGYEVAGKTGTAQKVVDGQYSYNKYVASFIGFVPADDPAFVLLVVADEPSKGGYYGGTVAAPAFSRIAEQTLRYLQVAPAKPVIRTAAAPAAAALPVYEPLPAEPMP